MKLETYIVNAFTEEIASGNPAGVVLLQEDLPQELMQRIAFDINKSETAFVKRTGHSEFSIRWFAPLTEVPICGHATLGASKVIFHTHPDLSEIRFAYKDGTITVNQDEDGNIAMLFPLDEYKVIDIAPEFYDFFNLREIKTCIQGVNTRKVILILDKGVNLQSIKPDYRRMKESKGKSDHGIGITKLSARYDFESRYFNPWYGVDEDPVTGSVHTVLANYWNKQLNKKVMTAYQNSQRPGELTLSIKNGNKVEIKGKARIFVKGHIEV
jgi:PhzF family phenazine biosynthesis protein